MCCNIDSKVKAETGRKPCHGRDGNPPSEDGKPNTNTNEKGRNKIMARERLVTRTVTSVNYNVMVVDTESKTVDSIIVVIPSGDTLTEKAREKAIKAEIPEGKIFVQIVSEEITETLYGMSEVDFIKLAKVLPPRTKTE